MRFPKFKGEWSKIVASNILNTFPTNSLTWEDLNYKSGNMKDIHYGLIHSSFKSTIIEANDKSIPYINENIKLKKYTQIKDGDLILADASEDTKEIGEPIELKNMCKAITIVSGLHTIHCRDIKSQTVPGFKGFMFQTPNIKHQFYSLAEGTKIFSISPSTLKELKISFPVKEEQIKITNFFTFLEQRIALQRKTIEDLEKCSNFIINNKFGTEGIKRKISEFLTEKNIKSTIENEYEVLSSTKKGIYKQSEYFNKEHSSPSTIGYKLVELNDIVISPQNLWLGNISFNDKYQNGLVSPSYKVFKIKEGFDKTFISNLLKTHRALYEYKCCSEQGASVVRRNLDMDAFLEISFNIPSLEEQKQISSKIKSFKLKIDSERKKLKTLFSLKQYLLRSLFI